MYSSKFLNNIKLKEPKNFENLKNHRQKNQRTCQGTHV